MEQYCFSPKEVLKIVSTEQYLTFLTYALEFRAIIMEQLSFQLEEQYCRDHPNEEDRIDGYGVILMDYTIRDFKGLGMKHIGGDGRSIVKAALELGLRKCIFFKFRYLW
jgi:hypothetical protein